MSFFTTSPRSELDSAHFDTIAFAYDAIGIPIAAGVLCPAVGLLLSPIVAALARFVQFRLCDRERSAPAR
jgi:hypothetical protein